MGKNRWAGMCLNCLRVFMLVRAKGLIALKKTKLGHRMGHS